MPQDGPGGLREVDDRELVAMVRRGCADAFAGVVRAYHPQVARLAGRLLGWPQDVEDVVQEVFLAALKGLPAFRGDSSLSTWLTRITINQCRSHRRRRWLGEILLDRLRRRAAAPAGGLDEDDAARVRQAVRRLPHGLREVVVLRYLQGLSVEQAAEALRLTPAAMHQRLHRARERLKESLTDLFAD